MLFDWGCVVPRPRRTPTVAILIESVCGCAPAGALALVRSRQDTMDETLRLREQVGAPTVAGDDELCSVIRQVLG